MIKEKLKIKIIPKLNQQQLLLQMTLKMRKGQDV